MWGYELRATGNKNFSYFDSGWSEGDLWLVESAMGANKINKKLGYHEALIEAVEGQFTKIKEMKLDHVAGSYMDFNLKVTGSFNFSYRFQPSKTPETIRFELVKKIADCYNDMGDQVMLSFCEAIMAYQIHYASRLLNSNPAYNELKIDIQL